MRLSLGHLRFGLSLVTLPALLIGLRPEAFAQEELPPPWELTKREPGEPSWAPLLRLREAEPRYRDTQWWSGYAQMRAHVEAGVGNHAAALEAWDWATSPRDSVGILPPGTEARDVLEVLGGVADTARIVMVNERHHAASDRLLTLDLLPILWSKGFRYFAAETLDDDDTELQSRGYPVEATGVYTKDPVFAAVIREALRLGYTLVPYESTGEIEEGDEELTKQQHRDLSQARILARATVDRDPEAKVLVHAGYSHIVESATERFHPMAIYFRDLTGIDPVTVDQTRLSERSEPAYEHPAYRAAVAAGHLDEGPVVLVGPEGRPWSPADFDVDFQVFTPRTTYTDGRPDWMTLGGRREVAEVEVPESARGWCYVEVRMQAESPEAVPLDRAEGGDAAGVRLFLPVDGRFDVYTFGRDGETLRKFPVGHRHAAHE